MENRLTSKIDYFDEPITSDEELFKQLKDNGLHYMVFIRNTHAGVETWDNAIVHYNKYEKEWQWDRLQFWKSIHHTFEYHAYVKMYEVEEFLRTYVQCVVESCEED